MAALVRDVLDVLAPSLCQIVWICSSGRMVAVVAGRAECSFFHLGRFIYCSGTSKPTAVGESFLEKG